MVKTAKWQMFLSRYNLTSDEAAAVYLYTMRHSETDRDISSQLSTALRLRFRQLLTPWFPYLQLLITALNKLPSMKGTIWRYSRGHIADNYRKDCVWKHKIPSDELDFLSDPHLLKEFDVHCTESGVAGNEALIRLTPVSLFFYRYPTDAVEFAGISGAITHDSPKAYDSCRYYGALIVAALRGETKQQLLDDKFYLNHKSWFNNKPLNPDVMKVAQGSYKKAGEYHDRIRGKGYIVDALETALWTFYYDEGSFEKGILDAVNRGDDTDATAAIYGPLAGAYYGFDNLPKKWISQFLTTPHPMKLIAQLQLNYMDGSCQYIVSDSSWLTTVTGPLLESSWYGGEEYDARKELIGWDTPTYDHSTWKMADISSIPNPNAIYRARESPSIQIVEEIVAISVTDKGDGTYIFDFGINHAGWPKLSMRGARGTTVTIRPGELLNLDETINQVTEGTPIYDRYTFSGNGIETYAPTFRYHGFRYLQIENLTYLPQVNDFKSYTLRINNDVTGTFNSSIELLNSIHKIVNRAVQSNMFSVFTDCPHREKLGWLEETHLVFPAIERFFDVQAHGRSVVRRIAEAQLSNGMVPTTAPEFPIFNGAFRDEPNWGNSIILLPLYLYQSYGEIALLEEFYSNMVSWIDYLRSKAQNNIVSYGLGDWYAIDQSTPVGVTGTYGYWMSANGLEKIASALNKTDDAKKYSDLASQISSAFHRTYFNATAHTYATGSQAADVFALEMGAVPVTEQQNVIQHLINDIRERSNHTSSGEVSLPSWFRMLSFYGHDDVIYDFLSRTDSPSYGYAIIHGATSLTEDWDGPAPAKGQPLSSQNHFMFGAVDEWFMRSLAGIQQVANSIDYRILNIKPVIVGNISHVEATYRTTRGWIEIQWNRVEEVFTLKVMLPYGSIAKVYVPGTKATSDYGTQIQIRKREAMTVFKIESGSYTFKSVIDVNTKQN
ncbi:unnamed protein product [Rotaria sp. Silwood1]|nr:unnamed protein product [Rotaria sp. Silwood1]